MFVAASLVAAGNSLDVRVRNMSRHGALIEGPVMPPVGTPVDLVRGRLSARGKVAWVAGNRCGLALDDLVDTLAWMSRSPPAHQAEIDAKLAEARRAMAASQSERAAIVEPQSGYAQALTPAQEEIDLLVARIESLGEQLVADPDILARHSVALQIVDEVQQRLKALGSRSS